MAGTLGHSAPLEVITPQAQESVHERDNLAPISMPIGSQFYLTWPGM